MLRSMSLTSIDTPSNISTNTSSLSNVSSTNLVVSLSSGKHNDIQQEQPSLDCQVEMESTSQSQRKNDKEPLSPSTYLMNPDLFLPNKEFFALFQDPGVPNIDPRTKAAYVRKPKKTHLDKKSSRLYKDVYKIGFKLYDIYEGHPNIFVEFGKQQKKNKGWDIERICK